MMLDGEDGELGARTYRKAADESISQAVVRAVSRVSGRSPLPTGDDPDPIEPLYDAVDPDALELLFRAGGDGSRATVRVEFVYCGFEVCVHGTDVITVTER